MAGNTSNTSILGAINQAIKAINDLIIGSGTTVVQAPNVTVRPNITINCTCGGGGGTKLPDDTVSETDTPPEGYEPDQNIDERKCKAANYVFTAIYNLIDSLNKAHADTKQTATIALFSSLVLALIGSSMLPVVGTIIGAVAGIALALFTEVDAGDILRAMENRKQDIICAWYNAGDTTTAKDDFLSIMGEEGIEGVAYIEFMGYFLYADTLKVLFQAVDWVSEATIGAYEGSNCGGCGGDDDGYTWDFSINSNGGTNSNQEAFIASVNGIASSYDGGGHWWGNYGSYTTMKLRPGKDLVMPSGTIVKIWWENAEGSAQGNLEQYQVSQAYGYFPGPSYGGTSQSEVAINRDWTTSEIILTPTLGALRITKIVIVGVF